jgi:hypothetical protein
LNVVVGQSASILELLASKDETLLVRRNSCTQTTIIISVTELDNQTKEQNTDYPEKQHENRAHSYTYTKMKTKVRN